MGGGGWLLDEQHEGEILLKFPVSITGKAGKATRTLVAGAALAVAAGGLGVSAAYAAPVEGPAPAPAESSANGINSVTGSTPGASTATGGPVY